ncbi:hypothetical protein HPB51_024306 [Rhipicephalus microplus]|uniref:Uncharacterized protein n=1 Tax=Rhipicephalus microplus TaxID=6941 RepID=A0A9J6EV09_RHIMP|nr:hypothetical protein HPB51_024306 [Rhipicephalus microplus]
MKPSVINGLIRLSKPLMVQENTSKYGKTLRFGTLRRKPNAYNDGTILRWDWNKRGPDVHWDSARNNVETNGSLTYSVPTLPPFFVREVTELAVGMTELIAVLQSKTNPPTPLASVVFLLFVHYKTATCQQICVEPERCGEVASTLQCEVTEKAAVCEVPPEEGTRHYHCDMQSDYSAERKEQQLVVSEIAPREGTRISDGAKVVQVESGAVADMRTVASPKGGPCETKAGSSRPDRVIDELERTLEPRQVKYLSDIKREDKCSPKCSEDIPLLKPDRTARESEPLLKVFPTDSVGNASEGENVHCEAVVGVQTGTSSVEDRFEEEPNPSSMNKACELLETCLVQRHVNDPPGGKNYPEIEQDANFQKFRSVEEPEFGFVMVAPINSPVRAMEGATEGQRLQKGWCTGTPEL